MQAFGFFRAALIAALVCASGAAWSQADVVNSNGLVNRQRATGEFTQGTTLYDANGHVVDADHPVYVTTGPTGATKKLVSSTLTRIGNTTAYAGTPTAPAAVCLYTSVTACAPLTMTVSSSATVNGWLTALRLIKSTTGSTGATFQVLAYQAAPTLTSVYDTTVYTPKRADLLAGAFVGYWTCGTQVVNGDNSTYECVSTSNGGNQSFALTDGVLRFVPLATGSYAPGAGETFNVEADILASAP